jgi:hypothetical protein
VSTHHKFRPLVAGEALEDRLVLSQGTAAEVSGAHVSALQAIHSAYAQQFSAAFNNFAQGYAEAAATTLLSGDATTIPSNRAVFDQMVVGGVAALAAQLSSMLTVSPLAMRAGVIGQVQEILGGNGPDSLVNQLAAIASPTDTNGNSAGTFGTSSSQAILNAEATVFGQLNTFFSPKNPTRAAIQAPTGGSRQEIATAYVRQIQRAYAAFSNSYSSAVQDTLFNGGASAIPTNVGTFQGQVATAVESLQSDLVTMLSISPRAANSLIPELENALTGDGPDSLISQLLAITSPTDVTGQTADTFGSQSSAAIDGSFRTVVALLRQFAANPGVNLTTATQATTSTFGNGIATSFPNAFPSGNNAGSASGSGGSGGGSGSTTGTTVNPSTFSQQFFNSFNAVSGSFSQNAGLAPGGAVNAGVVGVSNPNAGVITSPNTVGRNEAFGTGFVPNFGVNLDNTGTFLPATGAGAGNALGLGPGFLGAFPGTNNARSGVNVGFNPGQTGSGGANGNITGNPIGFGNTFGSGFNFNGNGIVNPNASGVNIGSLTGGNLGPIIPGSGTNPVTGTTGTTGGGPAGTGGGPAGAGSGGPAPIV